MIHRKLTKCPLGLLEVRSMVLHKSYTHRLHEASGVRLEVRVAHKFISLQVGEHGEEGLDEGVRAEYVEEHLRPVARRVVRQVGPRAADDDLLPDGEQTGLLRFGVGVAGLNGCDESHGG